jgi:hypothetical protein
MTSVKQLADAQYQQLIPLGIPKGTAKQLIQNAKQLMAQQALVQIEDRSAVAQPKSAEPLPSGVTEEDIANAAICNLELAEYLALTPGGRAREVRVAMMQTNVEPPDEDFVNDLNLGDMTARDFLRKQRLREQELRRVKKIEQSEAVTSFAQQEVHGHSLKDEPINVHGQRLEAGDEEAPPAPIDGIVIRRPKRKKTGRRSSEVVQQIVDGILD